MSVTKKVNEVFRMVFDDSTIEIRPEMTAGDIDGWDSLSHVNLIIAIESALGIRFTPKELLKQRNVGDLIVCIEEKVACGGS